MGSHGTLDHGAVLSPLSPPTSALTDSRACIAAQGHGTPDRMPHVCPTGESPCIASIMDPTGVLTPHYPAPPAVVGAACLTPAASDGGLASCLERSPIPLAQRPKDPFAVDCSPCSRSTVATVKACNQSSDDPVTTLVEYPGSLEQSPMRRKRPRITPPSNGAPLKCAKIEKGTKTAVGSRCSIAQGEREAHQGQGRKEPANFQVLEVTHFTRPVRCKSLFLPCRGPKPACYQ